MKNKVKSSNKIFGITSFSLLSLYTLVLGFLLLWSLMSSFKHDLDFVWNPLSFPDSAFGWKFDNYLKAWSVFNIPLTTKNDTYVNTLGMFLNSLLYAGGGAFFTIMITCLMAYCCSKFECTTTRIIYTVVIFVIVTPIVGSLPSEFQIAKTFHFYDNMFGLYVMKSYFANVYFLIFYAMFKGIPDTYTEAALLDGAGYWRIFIRIMIPLASSTLVAVFLLQFIALWNDYSTPLIYLPSYPPLAYGLYELQNSRDNLASEPIKIAACFIVSLPIIIIFTVFSKRIMTNVSVGGLKG